jgi:DNA-directed RNA polymerase specialized sigma subunit
MFIDNIDIEDLTDIELKKEKEEKYKLIDRNYTKIPKTYFQDLVWSKYFVEGKTHRQIGKELEISHCLSFHEIKNIKQELIKKIQEDLNNRK